MKVVLSQYSKSIQKKAAHIRALFFDVDGVLTDGKITYDDAGREIKSFNVKDGYIIAHLKQAGIVVGIITGRESGAVAKRAAELRLDFCHQGIVDKRVVVEKMAAFHKLKKKEIAYIGDDLNDLPTLAAVGLAVCPADAMAYIKTQTHFVTFARGGDGVVREVADLILAAQGKLDKIAEA